jgi:hypothetical protein
MDYTLTPLGWTFMLVSLSCVYCLAAWCYRRVLTAPAEPAKPVEDFHSA